MKKLINTITTPTLLTLSILLSTPVIAIDGLSANTTVSSNYLWRGISQTKNAAAVSGGIDYENTSGFSIGAWASNANWAENMTYELDLYAAYSSELNNGIGYSIGYIYYNYDNDAAANFSEINLALSYDAYTMTYNTLVDSDSGGDLGDDTYISANAEFDIAPDLALTLHIGHYDFEYSDSYVDYGVSLSKNGFTFTLSDTNTNGADGDINVVISYSVDLEL